MAGKDIIMVRQKELRCLHVIHKVLEGEITQEEAAELVCLSERQIRRIVRRIREEGDTGIAHRSRGRESNRKKPKKLRERIIVLYQEKYSGFGPTLAAEKLSELDGIEVSDETLRLWLLDAGIWEEKRRRKKHRQWRERKHHMGEMLQMDGSPHDWFEGRGPKCVLMAYIDDATGKVFCRFYEYEGTIPAMDSFRRYIRKYGLPLSVYLDKHTTYKSWAKLTDEEIMAGREEPLSQFQRALQELGVQVIHAHSPQAKGRVERLFGTLQDRLVKEMRLRGIKSIDEANEFLKDYLPVYNKRFEVEPAREVNLHRRLTKGVNLDRILCIKTQRTLRNDNTVAHEGKLYQVEEAIKGEKVIIEQRIDGSMKITYKGEVLRYREITQRPLRQQKPASKIRRHKSSVLAADHPYRKTQERLFKKRELRKQMQRTAA